MGYIAELEKASIIIVTYNHRKYIEACITSIEQESYPHEIIVVDSLSKDGTSDFVRERFPQVLVIECQKNLGYGCGNNLGVRHAKGDYVVILNPDTVVRKGWLEELIKPIKAEERIITTPKILTYDGSAINTCGNINHFTGLTFTRGLGEDPEAYSKPEFVSGFSGCCFGIKHDDYQELGGFDERFFLYNEDSDLSWRAHLRGFKILFVPTSMVLHDYKLRVQPEKLYYLEKGRYLILRKYVSQHSMVFLVPSLAMAEVLTFGYSARLGFRGVHYKIRALMEGLVGEKSREAKDMHSLYQSLNYTIPEDQLSFNPADKLIKNIANRVFIWNMKVVR